MASMRMIKEEPELCIIDDPYISEMCQYKKNFVDICNTEHNKTIHDSRTAEMTISGKNINCIANIDSPAKTSRTSASTTKYLINDCSICYKEFRKLIDYELHMSKVHGIQPYECERCGIKFSRKSNLAQHFRDHNGKDKFNCKRCSASFSRFYHLRRHECTNQRIYPSGTFRQRGLINDCSVCYKKFKKLGDYESHMSKIHNIKPYECSTCGMKFSRKSYLMPHFRVHTGVKPYPCKQCPVSFSRASDFKKHIRSHQGISLFKCELCDKRFTRAFSLRYHLGSHTGERPFVCEVCGIGFRKSTLYNYHKKTHSKKTFECVFCKEKFRSRISTAYHTRTCN